MNNHSGDSGSRQTIEMERRPSDFRRIRQLPLLQMGGTCCTCCCCLHWVGAVIGGVHGIVRAGRKYDQQVGQPSRSAVWRAFWLTALVFGIFIAVTSVLMASGALPADPNSSIGTFFVAMAFVPSLFFLPGGGIALMITLIRQRKLDPTERTAFDIDYACRVIWMSFWFSTIWGVLGYLIMLPILYSL